MMDYIKLFFLGSCLSLSVFSASAEDAPKAVILIKDAKSDTKEMKSASRAAYKAAYKIAKDTCLKENKELKGKQLKECIVSKNK